MKTEAKILMQLSYPRQTEEIPTYEISGKDGLKDLLNKFQIVRILTDGNVCYGWNALYFEHEEILGHLKSFGKNVSKLCKFNLTKTTLFFSIPQKVEVGKEFLRKFIQPKSMTINGYGISYGE